MKTFLARASSAGKLMTAPRNKSEALSETTKSYIKEWLIEQIYGFRKEIKSKYIDKGNKLEDTAIDKAIEWLDLDFVMKNEDSFEDEFFTGTPDIITNDEILEHFKILTQKLNRRISKKDWIKYAKKNNLPQSFSNYRNINIIIFKCIQYFFIGICFINSVNIHSYS